MGIFDGMSATKYKIRKNFLIAGILVTGLISAIIGVVAYFGLNMGTFVISLEDEAQKTGIALSEDPNQMTKYPRLLVSPQTETWPVSYCDLKIDKAVEASGIYDDPEWTYLAYSFYLINDGDTTVNLDFTIRYSTVTLKLDSAIRILLIEDGKDYTVYIKDDSGEQNFLKETELDYEGKPKEETPIEYLSWYDDEQIGHDSIEYFRPGDVKKYTVLIWIEGWDNQCKNDRSGGQVKFDMIFNIVKVLDEKDK